MDQVTLTGNNAAVGGAVAGDSLDLTATHGSITMNAASSSMPQASVTFVQPALPGIGGGVFLRQGSMDLDGVTLTQNTANQHGGAIYTDNTALMIQGTLFSANEVSFHCLY